MSAYSWTLCSELPLVPFKLIGKKAMIENVCKLAKSRLMNCMFDLTWKCRFPLVAFCLLFLSLSTKWWSVSPLSMFSLFFYCRLQLSAAAVLMLMCVCLLLGKVAGFLSLLTGCWCSDWWHRHLVRWLWVTSSSWSPPSFAAHRKARLSSHRQVCVCVCCTLQSLTYFMTRTG